ncbi:transcription elongation protein SprT [Haloferax sp. Atlit-12N]|uniref:SprT-like domain-containing protein n=1 Tax=Haloferax sp. Atlit-12N TaxID=2077203 RepID=UPI000E24F10C|nr:SprT-like domain-containing protein [Haloferax sp. Atlit-12N]RDZ62150.1 transcription elongation protein SprT [Haloferax sp. Atlit-12N]
MGHEDGSPGGYDAIETGDELVSWSRTYCRHAASQYEFDVDLHRVRWEVSTRAKRRAAAVKTPNIDDAEVGEPRRWTGTSSQSVELDIAPTCTMSLSWRAFESFDRGEWTATLRHELVHVEQFQAFGATDHGPAFKRRAEAVDAPVRVRRFAEPKYTLTCEACGADVAYRYRECKLVRESSAYRSACCEAPLDCRERQD